MRADMHKVVIERPRVGRSYANAYNHIRKAKRFKFEFDDDGSFDVNDEFCNRRSLRARRIRGWDTKEFSDLLGPLKRFLQSRKGKLWNDVYSEIRSGLSTGSTIHQHILQHLDHMVATKTYIGDDGKVWEADGRPYPVSTGHFYVHPETGILLRNGQPTRYRYVERPPKYEVRRHRTDEGVVFIKRPNDGTWFYAAYAQPDQFGKLYAGLGEVFRIDIFNSKNDGIRESCASLYGAWNVWVHKLVRTASKKEIRDYHLK